MFSLKNKKVLITGATGGIGSEIANLISSLGAHVVITGTKEERLKELSKKLVSNNTYIVANLNNIKNIEVLNNELAEKKLEIDILINNAGIAADNLFLRMKEDDWSNVLNVNLNSTILLTQKLIRGMIKEDLEELFLLHQ